jgi:hypothetical protein
VDHNTKTTSWVDPRDIFIKPFDFATCQGHEFPFGWELASDPACGEYFIDHASWSTTLTDPRIHSMNHMLAAGADNNSATASRAKLLEDKLRSAEEELNRLHRELRAVPPLHRESVVLQERIGSQLDKVGEHAMCTIIVCHSSSSHQHACAGVRSQMPCFARVLATLVPPHIIHVSAATATLCVLTHR